MSRPRVRNVVAENTTGVAGRAFTYNPRPVRRSALARRRAPGGAADEQICGARMGLPGALRLHGHGAVAEASRPAHSADRGREAEPDGAGTAPARRQARSERPVERG